MHGGAAECSADSFERLASAPCSGAQHQPRPNSAVINVGRDASGGFLPSPRKRSLVVGERRIVPARLGVTKYMNLLHAESNHVLVVSGKELGPVFFTELSAARRDLREFLEVALARWTRREQDQH